MTIYEFTDTETPRRFPLDSPQYIFTTLNTSNRKQRRDQQYRPRRKTKPHYRMLRSCGS